MNFICNHFLEKGFTEEETFWILVYIFEQMVYRNYYVDIFLVMVDLELFLDIIKQRMPGVYFALVSNNIELTLVLVPLFLTLCTNMKCTIVSSLVG